MSQFLKDAGLSFVYWTLALTPYMLWVVGIDKQQYMAWLLMQVIIVPPFGALYSFLLRRFF